MSQTNPIVTDHPPTSTNHLPPDVLTSDILWLIFDMNADIFSYRGALTTTRFSSQVCREWRSVILDAQSLWGKLIDLDGLSQKRDEWREEVLRRSGNSPLSIYRIRSSTKWTPQDPFFAWILNEHWCRIERLNVIIVTQVIKTALQMAIINPAPLLRLFKIAFNRIRHKRTDVGSIFANHAPNLEIFDAPDIRFQLPASGLSNLRSLFMGPYFSLLEASQILQSVPLLETLHFHTDEPFEIGPNDLDTHSVSLPLLREININAPFPSGSGLLGCLTDIHSVTSLKACLLNIPEVPEGDHHWATKFQILSRIVHDYFLVHSTTDIAITIDLSLFRMTAGSTGTGTPFLLELQSSGWPRPVNLLPCLLPEFSRTHFTTVVELDLQFDPDSTKRCIAIFTAFLSSFPSIRVLAPSFHSGKSMRQISPNSTERSQVLFPTLKTLKYSGFRGQIFSGGPIRQFIVARRDIGHPISFLDLTEYDQDLRRALTWMDSLEDMKGLKILWRRTSEHTAEESILEHICGSGNLQTVLSEIC